MFIFRCLSRPSEYQLAKSIQNGDLNELQRYMQHDSLIEEFDPGLSVVKPLWLHNCLLYCTIYNRPTMLAKFRNISSISSYAANVYGTMLIRFASTLRYTECQQELNKSFIHTFFHKCKKIKDDVQALASKLFEFDRRFDMDVDVFKRSFEGVLYMDLDGLSFARKISLKGALSYDIQYEKLKALFDIGCDINASLKYGGTPFVYLCVRLSNVVIDEMSFAMVENVKVCLQQNPSVQLTRQVTQSIVSFESKISEHAHCRKANMAAYSLLTSFHLHGYDFSSCQLDQCNTKTRHKVASLSRSTRSLKESCRIVLRQHYTGRSIHKFVHTVKVPRKLKRYILMKDVLVL